jgi:DNA-directed RNA polymerase alpha subunit
MTTLEKHPDQMNIIELETELLRINQEVPRLLARKIEIMDKLVDWRDHITKIISTSQPISSVGTTSTPIESLELETLRVRIINSLKMENIQTIEELLQKSRNELEGIPNVGRKSINEIERVLALKGLKLRQT